MARLRKGREAKIVGVGAISVLYLTLFLLITDFAFAPVAVHVVALADLSLKNAPLVHNKQKPEADTLTAKRSVRIGAGSNGAPDKSRY